MKRFYLLFVVIASLIYPFLPFDILSPPTGLSHIYQVVLPEVNVSSNNTTEPLNNGFLISGIYTLILLTISGGAIFLFLKLIMQVMSVLRLRLQSNSMKCDNYRLIHLNKNIAPFSFFKWIFLASNIISSEDHNTIIAHERVHASQYHSFDIMLYELFSVLFWWNPVVWMLKKEVRINLEYLADEETLNKGYDPKKYQYLLLEITNYNTGIHIVNNFNVSQLKKRIIMINKRKSTSYHLYKYLLLIPVSMLVLSLNATNVVKTAAKLVDAPVENNELQISDKNKVYDQVEVMPEFPGGINALLKYITQNLKYPETAVKYQIEGRVVVKFVVRKTGEVTDVKVLRSLSPECDAEAVRVVKSMPKWTPGKQGGKDVAVFFTLPIMYKLNN